MAATVLGTPRLTVRAIVPLLLSPFPLPPLLLMVVLEDGDVTGLLVVEIGLCGVLCEVCEVICEVPCEVLCEVLCVDEAGTFTPDEAEDNILLEELGNIVESSLGGGPEKVSFVGSEQLALPSAFVLQQYQSRSWLL